MKILHVMSSLDPASGGPAKALVGLASAQVACGARVCAIATNRDEADRSYVDQLEQAGVTVVILDRCTGPLRRHPDLKDFVRNHVQKADALHVHGLWEQVQHEAALASRHGNKPHIFRPCGMLDPWSLSQRWLKKRIYMAMRLRRDLNNASLLHFTSRTERELTTPLRLKSPSVIEFNGVDLTEFEQMPAAGTFRKQFPQLHDRPMVLFLSRLHEKKGLDLLIPAFAEIKNKQAMLVLAGPDDRGYKSQVQDMIHAHGLADRVLLPGMLKGSQKVAAFAEADLFVLPSYQENFGIAVVEALATGTPVIVSDQVNIHDAITQAKVGAVVPTQVQPLARMLDHWLDNADERAAASARAVQFVQHNYDWNEIAARWLVRYESLIGGSLPADARLP